MASKNKTPDDLTDPLSFYGSDEDEIKELIERDKVLGVSLGKEVYITPAQIIFAVRNEMARTVEDVLARRTRILFIDAKIASSLAAKVAEIMMEELNKDEEWRKAQTGSFKTLAKGYLLE